MSSITPPDFDPPAFDPTARTEFLRRTIARAMTPRARARVHALRELERLIAIKADGRSLGVQGHLLASIARDYPVSNRAMSLELFGHGPQGLVDVAEQVELRMWAAPPSVQAGPSGTPKRD